jgi:predicted DNA-binding protein
VSELKGLVVKVEDEAWEKLTILCAKTRKTKQALLKEAIEMLFEKYKDLLR